MAIVFTSLPLPLIAETFVEKYRARIKRAPATHSSNERCCSSRQIQVYVRLGDVAPVSRHRSALPGVEEATVGGKRL